MKLEQATAVLRPRSSWEAIDLGCALARRHWGKLIRGWLSVALPLWALILLVFRESPGWAIFFVLWTKPVLTRQPVFFMSRALFGQVPGVGEFWRSWRTSFRGILAALTFKRFAAQRPFRLPVIMLEGQRGRGYAQRAAVLSAHGGGSAGGLTFVASFVEAGIALGLGWAATELLWSGEPGGISALFEQIARFRSVPDSLYWTFLASTAASIALMEPFYSAAGFALYINSRTHLEGWDIEVAFRRMSARLQPAAVSVAMFCLFLLPQGTARAAAGEGRDARAVVQEILNGPDFEIEKRRVPVYKEREEKAEDEDTANHARTESGGGGADRSFFGYAIIAALIVAIALVLWLNRGALRGGARSSGGGVPVGPRVVMGMDLAPESLPEDIPAAAWREYLAGRHLDALRLLYRGSLAWLVSRAGLPVHESDTEGDCLRHTSQMPDAPRVSFFSALTSAWINCAYAGQPPAPEPMKQLCEQWPFSLRQKPAPAATASLSASAPILLLALTSAVLCLPSCSGRREIVDYREETVGYKGAARINPWLAAERMLTAMGTPAETHTGLTALPDANTALFIPLGAITSRGEARRILRWVSWSGGHLIVACAGTARFHNDFDESVFDWLKEESLDASSPLLAELHVEQAAAKPDKTGKVEFAAASFTIQNHDGVALDLSRHNPDVVGGTASEAVVASFDHGSGRVTILAGATPFRNRYLAEHDHAAILQRLINLQPVTSVLIISRSDINLWTMLMTYAWMPVTATVLLILLWLWRHLPRFGRAVPADDSNIRHFGTQIDEAGRFLSDRAGPAALLAAARRAVLLAAAQRGLRQEAPDFMDQLAARSGLTHSEISTALLDSTEKNLVPATAALQKLHHAFGTN